MNNAAAALAYLATLALSACAVTQGDGSKGLAEPAVRFGGACDFAKAEKGVYQPVETAKLGQCILLRPQVDGVPPKFSRVIPDNAEHLFTTGCTVTIQRVDKQLKPCERTSPLAKGDQFTIFADPNGGLQVLYRYAGIQEPVLEPLETVRIPVPGGDVTMAYKATFPGHQIDEKYYLFFYLQNRPTDPAGDSSLKFYDVELFSSKDTFDCKKEQPGKNVSKPVDCATATGRASEWVPLVPRAPIEGRQTGSAGGGEPPKDP